MENRSSPQAQASESSSPSLNSLLSKKDQKILNNHREILWLKRQISDLEGSLHPRLKERAIPDQLSMDDLHDYRLQVDNLRSELFDVSSYNFNKEHITNSVYNHYFVNEALYPLETDNLDQIEKKRAIQDKILERDTIVTKMINLHHSIQNKKKTLDGIQRETRTVDTKSREMFSEYRRLEQSSENKLEDMVLLERESQLQDQIEMTRRILQHLMMESRFDWSRSPKWLDVMLRIGEEFEVINRRKNSIEGEPLPSTNLASYPSEMTSEPTRIGGDESELEDKSVSNMDIDD